jgi:RNA polymerase sigma-70 factor (ECF subfamily)
MDTERELMRCMIDGDRGAFAELDRLYRGLLLHIARRALGPSGRDAQDVLHDVLVSLMSDDARVLRTYRSEAPLACWLGGLVRHRCLDRARRLAVRRAGPLDDNTGCAGAQCNLEDCISVREALQRVSARDRRLLRLFFFEGFSYEEMALILGMPKNTVASCLLRAKARIREALEPLPRSQARNLCRAPQ